MGSCLSSGKKNSTSTVTFGGKGGSAGDSGIKETGYSSNSKPLPAPGTGTANGADGSTKIVTHHAIQLAFSQGKKVVRGIYDYVPAADLAGEGEKDLPFKKGDLMEVIKDDGDWLLAKSMLTDEVGYIPNSYVAPENGLEQFDWFHGKIARKDAEKQLMLPGNVRGTFLVRESETNPGTYSLSMLDEIEVGGARLVKHYRIRDLDNGGCYINASKKCESLEELITHYNKLADGLCFRLVRPCAKSKPVMWDLSRDLRDKWEIERSTLDFDEKLGAGNFGEVYKGYWNKQTPVAIKTLKEGMMEVSKFLEEAAIMKKLRHPKLVTLYAVCSREEPIYIVTEFMINGSLLSYLRNDRGKTLSSQILIDIAAQIADGMRYIEDRHYIHRDLAARNILVGENNSVKIGDFGLARVINEEEYEAKEGAKFPIKWTAPEATMYGKFTIKSDVWAYGILLVELVTFGAIPYPGMTNNEVVTQLERNYRHPQPKGCSDALYEIMLTCWRSQPHERPTFDHLFNTMDDFTVATQTGYAETHN